MTPAPDRIRQVSVERTIAAPAASVFAALTDGNASVHYWHGTRIVSDWKVGAPFLLELEHDDKKIVGKKKLSPSQIRKILARSRP